MESKDEYNLLQYLSYSNIYNEKKIWLNPWIGHTAFANLLVNEYKPKTFVELGTYKGVSFFSFCQAVKSCKLDTKCIAIDCWDGDIQSGFYDSNIYNFVKKYTDEHYADFVTLKKMYFDEAIDDFEDESIDILHIDGLHTYEAVRHDFETWLPKVKLGGLILFHDVNEYQETFDAYRVWDEIFLLSSEAHLFRHSHGLGVWRKPGGLPLDSLILTHLLEKNTKESFYIDSFLRITAYSDVYQKKSQELENELTEIKNELSNTITELSNEITELTTHLNNKDNKIVELTSHILKINDEIKNLTIQVQDKEEQIVKLNIEFDFERKKMNSERVELEYAFNSERKELKNTFNSECERLNNELYCERSRYNSLLNSKSMKITRPLRVVADKLRLLRKINICGFARKIIMGVCVFPASFFWYKHFSAWKGEIKHVKLFLRNTLDHSYAISKSLEKSSPLMRFFVRNPLLFAAKIKKHESVFRAIFSPSHEKEQKKVAQDFNPLVSVIVPNYNHAPYLEERLHSILNQSYQNIEVILLDDCSSDESRAIFEHWEKNYPDKIRLSFNEENTGAPFKQWRKGIEMAQGALVWIAESDDFCTLNFLEELVPFFEDESVAIAYADSLFMQDGKQIWSLREYLHELSPDQWDTPFIQSAHIHVKHYLGIKNTIPNVSSCLFKNCKEMPLLQNEEWVSLRLCGDWIFYLHLIRGGYIAFTNKAKNYYRIHKTSTSLKVQKTIEYFDEHETVAQCVASQYCVDETIFQRQASILQSIWKQSRNDYTEKLFNEHYSIERIIPHLSLRKQNVIMCAYGFIPGGGETFPIALANGLKQHGYAVTFMDFHPEQRVEGIRKMLHESIPVVVARTDSLEEQIQELHAEIVHSHNMDIEYDIVCSKTYIYNYKHIVTTHGMYEAMPTEAAAKVPSILSCVSRWIYIADKNLEPFKDQKDYNPAIFFKLNNALERKKITPQKRSDYAIPDDAFLLCIASRGIPEKGWIEAIEAVHIAQEKSHRPVHLLIVGNGTLYETYKNKFDDTIHFVGFQTDVQNFFAMSDMGFMPSRFQGESLPLVVIECLFAGKPVLASDIGEVRNMLVPCEDCAAGVLFTLKNWTIPVHEVADLIVRIANDAEYYASLCSHVEEAANFFDLDTLVEQYGNQYSVALNHK